MSEPQVGDRVSVWLGGYGDQRIYQHGTVIDRTTDGIGCMLDRDGHYDDEGRIWRTSANRLEVLKQDT